MQTWIALLRGVNVGGNNILPMQAVRALFEDLGLERVRTYLQSGNCIFDSEGRDAAALAGLIAEAIERVFGFRPAVMVVGKEELDAAIAGNPYPEAAEDPKKLHVYFLAKTADHADLAELRQVQGPSERFQLSEKLFYLHAPDGVGRSKLAAQVERCLGVAVTARNLRSAMKIAELAV